MIITENLEQPTQLTILAAVEENEVLTEAKTINTTVSEKTRKRKRNPEKWKQNVRKLKRQHGHEYTDIKGKNRPARSAKSGMLCHSEKCFFHCSDKITQDERELINRKFWELDDNGKMHFYSKYVQRSLAARKRTAKESSNKTYTYEYSFAVSGVTTRVCQEFFLKTLNVSKQRIYYYFKKHQDPSTKLPISSKHGKHTKKTISVEQDNEVRAHIASFPAIESHYCRANTQKKYLERDLNIQKMYNLYRVSSNQPVKLYRYKQIFNSEFNISFFKPKKDLCDKCQEFKVSKEKSEEKVQSYEEHIKRKKLGDNERNIDRTRYENDKTVGVVTFDLQNTFSLPKANISNFYYKKKLACYNLTAHLNTTKAVYNAVWSEFICGRSAVHIANALIRILKRIMMDNPGLKRLILWSDSCVPQNKNSVMSFALQHFLNSNSSKELEIIEQKFSEPGHGNVQEIDAAHSCIERYLRHIEIWSPLHLIQLLSRMPKEWKNEFIVLQMRPSDYLNYQLISSSINYSNLPYTKVKHIIYDKNSPNVSYSKVFGEGQKETLKLDHAKARVKKTKGIFQLPIEVPPVKLTASIPELKKKHLKEMLPYIPVERDQEFFEFLLKV